MELSEPVKRLPGINSQKTFQKEQEYIAPGLQSIALFSQLSIARAENLRLFDEDGNSYIDFIAGIGVGSTGHCHPHYIKSIKSQLEKVTYGSFTTPARMKLLELLASTTPPELKKIQLFSSGAEAVEAAFRLAKSVNKKFEFIGFKGGFHGKTGGVLGLLGDDFKKGLGPFMPGSYLAPYANCYRCDFKLTYPECDLLCGRYLKKFIESQTREEIAGIVIETVQGTSGNVVPPPGFLELVRDIARQKGALFIVDEMQTGFGRTGKFWGFEHADITPDIICIGKGMGGGFPISGLISTEKHCQSRPFADPSGSSSSYGGNPLAAAAALGSLEIILNENLVKNAETVGSFMYDKFKEFEEKFEFVGEVRGRGLLLGLELVRNKESKEPLPKKITRKIFQECLARGLMSMCYNHNIRIIPPLTIDKNTAGEGISIMEEVFSLIEKEKEYERCV